jgi:WD40 repeat protein
LAVASLASPEVRGWPMSEKRADVLARQTGGKGIWSARFDPKAKRLVYAVDQTGQVVIRDLDSGQETVLRGGPKVVYDAQFSPDGKHVAAAPEDGQVAIWSVEHPQQPERLLKGHHGGLNWSAYGADGRFLTAGADRTARVWPAREGPDPVVLRGHTDEVTGAAFYDKGTKVLTTSFDGTLRLWDSRTGALLAVLESGPTRLESVVVSRNGDIAVMAEKGLERVFRCEVCGSLDDVRALALSRHPRQLTATEQHQYLAAAG